MSNQKINLNYFFKCDKNFSDIDLIILNPTDEKDLEANETKIKLRKELIAKAVSRNSIPI